MQYGSGCGHRSQICMLVIKTVLEPEVFSFLLYSLFSIPSIFLSCKDSGFRHFKLDDHSQRLHSGELSWQQFKTSLGKVMVGECAEPQMFHDYAFNVS